MLRRISLITLLCASLPLHAESAREAILRAAAVWSTGDAKPFASILAPSFPNASRELIAMAKRFRARCLVVRDLTAVITSEDAARATGTLTFHLAETLPGRPAHEMFEDVEVELIATGGEWRVAKWITSLDALAERLATADPSNFTSLVQTFPPDRELARAIRRKSVELSNASKDAQSRALAALAVAVAEQSGDDGAMAHAIYAEVVAWGGPTPHAAIRESRAREGYRLALRSGDAEAIGLAELYLGRLAMDTDESSREAEMHFLNVIARDDEIAEPTALARAATNAGVTRLTRGDYRGGLELLRLALERNLELGDPRSIAWIRLRIGTIYDRQNDLELARHQYEMALALGPAPQAETLLRVGLARTLLRLGKTEEAKRQQRSALELSRKLERPGLIGTTLVAMAESELLAGNHDAAAEHATEAVAQARTVGYRPAEIDALLTLAEIDRSRGRCDRALETIAEVEKLDTTVDGLGFALPAALMLKARCHHARGSVHEEKRALAAAIEHIEHSRTLVAGGERQLRLFFQPHSAAYTMMAAAAARAGNVEQALAYAERGRARVLYDLLQRGPADDPAASHSGIRPDLPATPGETPAITRADLERIVPRGTLLLEYVVGEKETHVIAIARDRSGAIRTNVHRIAVLRTELERVTNDFVRRIAGRDFGYRDSAKSLHALLLGPLRAELASATVLGICADGALWSLPFEALIGPDDAFLTERVATFYMPSLSSYRALLDRAVAARRSVLVVADAPATRESPALADAREEANELAKIYARDATVVRVGTAATERAVKRDAGAHSILHFAVHGVLDNRDPMYSRIILGKGGGEDGALQAWELARLRLRADMVVLSACDTGRGRVDAGEGMVGIAWALFVAGSRSAVVSHWPVSSRATRHLMVEFHRRYRAAPTTPAAKAEALRQARLTTLRDSATRHPFYWSSFVLVGS